MDLVYTWYGNTYWFQVFSSSISSHDHNLGVKVTDFEFLCLNFCVEVFRSSSLLYFLIDLVHTWYGDRY